MRRALVILGVLVVVAAAFTAGALIFRGGGGGSRKVNAATIHCGNNRNCDNTYDRILDDECRSADAVKMTVIYERYGDEVGRHTATEDC
jgi:hypothetical protein